LALSDKVAGRLRRAGFEAVGITLKLRDSNFKTVTRSVALTAPTTITDEIYEEALSLLARTSYRPGMLVRLIGVTASKIVPAGSFRQGELFMPEKNVQRERVQQAVDDIRNRFGNKMVERGALVGASVGRSKNDSES
jgi:DNA polymerase-4